MSLYNTLYTNYKNISKLKPIILNLTNSVTKDFIANTLLAIGASPIMSEDISEMNDLIEMSSSININIGTLNSQFNKLATNIATLGKKLHKPVILDPVGAGSTFLRTQIALRIAPYATIIRGNASEIIALHSVRSTMNGVDTIHSTPDAEHSGHILAKKYSNVIVISGTIDVIISNENIFKNYFGNDLMTKVTGMGCVLNAVIATFATVNKDYSLASYLAVIFYTLCAEKAINIAATPAKFKAEFIDTLYDPDWIYIEHKLSQMFKGGGNYD